VVLQVPNLAGTINHALLRALHMRELLDSHNLGMMNAEFFRAIAQQYGLRTESIEYAGGFDPGLMVYNHSYSSRWRRPPLFFLLKAAESFLSRFPGFLVSWNHPAFSMMLIAVFRVPEREFATKMAAACGAIVAAGSSHARVAT
jgi:hypothetical protein